MKDRDKVILAVLLGAVLVYALWCSIPAQYKPKCDNCGCPTCFENPHTGECDGYCQEGFECSRNNGVCICEEQF